jgi:hypothetical protein
MNEHDRAFLGWAGLLAAFAIGIVVLSLVGDVRDWWQRRKWRARLKADRRIV